MIYEVVIPQVCKMLQNLNLLLDKGAEYAQKKNAEVEVLLTTRLAIDQFNLIKQVQIACDSAKLGIARLAGLEAKAPSHPDTEQHLPELKARIQAVLSYLEEFSPEDFSGFQERRISQPRWQGKYVTGEEFLWQHLLPNLYFHVTTAYAIIRHSGVEIGKKDYLGPIPYKT